MVRIAYSDKPFACSVVIAGGGNGQFLAGGDDVDDGPAVVGEGLDERRVQVAGLLDATAEHPHRDRDRREVRIDEVGAEHNNAGGFHLQLDEVQRRVLNTMNLTGYRFCTSVTSSPNNVR